MTRLLTSLFLFLVCTAMAPIYPSSVMESNNIIVAPKLFWMKSVTNDIPFSNAVNAVLGPNVNVGQANGGGDCALGGAGGVLITTNGTCDYTINLNTNAVRDLIVKGFGYLTNVVTTNTSAGFTGLVQSIGIAFTNGYATTGYVNTATNRLASTNYVNTATNGLATTGYVDTSSDNAQNGAESYATITTNQLDTALRSAIASATNGHALLAQLVAATNTIDADKITVGTLSAARLPFTFLTNNQVGPTTLYGDAQKTNGVTVSSSGEVLSNALGNVVISSGNVTASGNFLSTNGTFTGNGSGLTNLSASSLASGTVPSARLSLVAGDINGLAPTFNGLTVTGAVLNVTATGSNNITGSLHMGAGLTNDANIQAATFNATGLIHTMVAGATGTSITNDNGAGIALRASQVDIWQAGAAKVSMGSSGFYYIYNSPLILGLSSDAGIMRNASGVIEVNTGAANTYATLLAKVLIATNTISATNGAGGTNFLGGYSRIVTNMAPFNTVAVTLTLGTSFTNTYGARGRLNVPFTLVDTVGGTPTLVFTNITTTETWNYATSFSLTGNYQDCAHIDVGNGEVVKFSDSSGGGASVTLQAGSIKLE